MNVCEVSFSWPLEKGQYIKELGIGHPFSKYSLIAISSDGKKYGLRYDDLAIERIGG